MSTQPRSLQTRKGPLCFPAYIPVTTFGGRYPLDDLVRPYLPRLAPAVMASLHYARQMTETLRLPLLVDSGGFASLFENVRVERREDVGVLISTSEGQTDVTHPRDALEIQERLADVAFTLDFPIPPGTDAEEARRRMELTLANAAWALVNRRRPDLPLYACVQGWDVDSFRECARVYSGAGFDGIAVGGLVPRSHDTVLVTAIVEAVRGEVGDLPLHVFGLGKPETAELLFRAGVDSVDSSSYVQLAADGRLWSHPGFHIHDPSPTDRLHLALCNLAAATGRTLPLSASSLVFQTHELAAHQGH